MTGCNTLAVSGFIKFVFVDASLTLNSMDTVVCLIRSIALVTFPLHKKKSAVFRWSSELNSRFLYETGIVLEVNLQHIKSQPEVASQQIRTQAETNSQKMDELIPDNQMLPKENVELKQEIEAETIVKLDRQCSNLNDELQEERLKFNIEEPENEYEEFLEDNMALAML